MGEEVRIRNPDAVCGTCVYWDESDTMTNLLDYRAGYCRNRFLLCGETPESTKWCGEHPEFELGYVGEKAYPSGTTYRHDGTHWSGFSGTMKFTEVREEKDVGEFIDLKCNSCDRLTSVHVKPGQLVGACCSWCKDGMMRNVR